MSDDPVGWLYDLQHSGIKLGLDNIRALLEVLEHPERTYPSVLIAGTNGKGSTACMIASALSENDQLPVGRDQRTPTNPLAFHLTSPVPAAMHLRMALSNP